MPTYGGSLEHEKRSSHWRAGPAVLVGLGKCVFSSICKTHNLVPLTSSKAPPNNVLVRVSLHVTNIHTPSQPWLCVDLAVAVASSPCILLPPTLAHDASTSNKSSCWTAAAFGLQPRTSCTYSFTAIFLVIPVSTSHHRS